MQVVCTSVFEYFAIIDKAKPIFLNKLFAEKKNIHRHPNQKECYNKNKTEMYFARCVVWHVISEEHLMHITLFEHKLDILPFTCQLHIINGAPLRTIPYTYEH